MRYFVPGGAGYIGSVLVGELLARGESVLVSDNLMYRQSSLLPYFRNQAFEFQLADFNDTNSMARLAAKADVVIPLAAIVGAPAVARSPGLAREVNLDAPLRFFKCLSKDQLLLMPTTNSAYGNTGANSICDESSQLRPLSEYAKAKVIVEEALMSRGGAISFRLATVFGLSPRMRLDLLLNDFTYQALSKTKVELFEPGFYRNFIHVADVARVFLHGVEHYASMKDQIFNVGLSSANLTKLEMCEKIAAHVSWFQYRVVNDGHDPDQRNYIVSNAKIERTGFLPDCTVDQGIEELKAAFGMLDYESMRN